MKKSPKDSNTFSTPSGKHLSAKVEQDAVKKISGEKKQDLIQAKNAGISKEKDRSVKKTGIVTTGKLFETHSYQEQETSPFEYISRAVKEYFGLTQVIYKENQTRWDFPKKIGKPRDTHSVFRIYSQVRLYIDIFNAKDPQDEIDRIKAHMEALGLNYTYVRGCDPYATEDGQITDDFKKLLFEKRLEPIDPKTLKTPLKVPKSLEEAGNRPLTVQA